MDSGTIVDSGEHWGLRVTPLPLGSGYSGKGDGKVDILWLREIEHLLRNGECADASSRVEKAASGAAEDVYVILGRSLLLYYSDDYQESLIAATAALEAARAAGDKLAEAKALDTQARALRMLGRHEESLTAATASVEAARAAGDKLAEASALVAQACALQMLERHEESLTAATAAVEAARAAGDKLAEANALDAQAYALRMLARYAESLSVATASLEAARAAGDKLAEANALDTQAGALRMLSRHDESLTAATAALDAARAAGDKLTEANALTAQAYALRMLDRFDESLTAATVALEAARAAGYKMGEANALTAQAHALRMLDRYEKSLSAATAAVAAAQAAGTKLGEANALTAQAGALRLLDRYAESLTAATAALEAARAAGSKLAQANALADQIVASGELGREAEHKEALAELAALDPERARWLETYPVRPGWDPIVRRIFKQKQKRERELRSVLRKPPTDQALPEGFAGKFQVLRKWASYTTVELMRPANAHSVRDGRQTGGGYFIWWEGWGLVVDPGLGFGEAFRSAEYVPMNISAVVATHHHIDHTGDMLPILTCVYEMNQRPLPTNASHHQVDFAFSPGAFSAFADVVAYVPGVRSVQLLRPRESTDLPLPGGVRKAKLTAVKAEHLDLTGHTEASIGLRLDLPVADDGKCSIGISGDTRFIDEKGWAEAYKDVDLMVVHIGSLYEEDIGEEKKGPSGHLGFAGTVELLKEIKKCSSPDWDPLVLISEWGEELGPDRTVICKVVAKAANIRRVFPAEWMQSVALGDGRARPICARDDGKLAIKWQENERDHIEYLCGDHDHSTEGLERG